jgi:hypothetical protein
MEKLYYLSKDNLLYVWQKIKLKLANKVDKIEGKGLSTNDLTDELKQKILNAGDSSFSGNYEDLINKPDLSTYAKTTDMNTAITSAVTGLASQEYVDNKITAVYRYKGSVANEAALPTSNQVVGDTYNLEDTGMNVAWNGTDWDPLGAIIDLTGYLKETDLEEITNAEIDEIFAE